MAEVNCPKCGELLSYRGNNILACKNNHKWRNKIIKSELVEVVDLISKEIMEKL